MRVLDRLLDESWFVSYFKLVAERECRLGGFTCFLEDEFLCAIHAAWLERCASAPHRIGSELEGFHFRLLGWLCFEIKRNDFHIQLHKINELDTEEARILRKYPENYINLTFCFEIVCMVEAEFADDPKDFGRFGNVGLLWSACETLNEDAREAVGYMQLAAKRGGPRLSFL